MSLNRLSRAAAALVVVAGGLTGVPASVDRPDPPPAAASLPHAHREVTARKGWIWPTGRPVRVLRGFRPPAKRWLAGHRGVDLAAEVGSPVVSPAAGIVAFAGEVAGVGVVSVDHADGVRSTFQPVRPLVAAGENVAAGTPLGILVAGHDADSLHLGARMGSDTYVNPLRFIVGPVILKPWD